MPRADTIHLTGTFQSRDEAVVTLKKDGDVALVFRGILRLMLMKCPCGCGDVLVINIDPRAGPAWKLYRRGSLHTLFPSYWRNSDCESHFVLWRNQIHWCDWDSNEVFSKANEIENAVFNKMPDAFISFYNLADSLDEDPWDVLQACNSLVRKGKVLRNVPAHRGEFRKAPEKASPDG